MQKKSFPLIGNHIVIIIFNQMIVHLFFLLPFAALVQIKGGTLGIYG